MIRNKKSFCQITLQNLVKIFTEVHKSQQQPSRKKQLVNSPHISEHVDHVRYLYQFSVFIFDQLRSFFKSRILPILPYSFSKWLQLVDFCKNLYQVLQCYLTKTLLILNHHSSYLCSFCNSPLIMNVFVLVLCTGNFF